MKEHQPQSPYGRQDRDRRGFEDYGQRQGEVRRGGSREQGTRDYRESGDDIERDHGGSRSYAAGRDYDYDQAYGESRYGNGSYRDEFGDRDELTGIGRRHFDDRFSVHGGLPAGGERYAGESEYAYGWRGRNRGAYQGERGASWNQGGARSDYDYSGRGRDPSGYGGGIYGGSATGGYPGYRESEPGGRHGGDSWRRGGYDWAGGRGEPPAGQSGEPGRGWDGERGAVGGYGYGMRGQDFRGRGPKGYLRSDERITEDICERLTQDPEIDASEVSIDVKDGTVTLRGAVDERWMKYRVEDIADGCSGVKDVRNELRIAKGLPAGRSGGLQGGDVEGRASGSAGTASVKH